MTEIKKFLARVFKGYKKVAHIMGAFNTRIILTVFYFTIIPIFTFIFYLNNKPTVVRSTWKNKKPSYPRSHEKQF